MAVSLRFALPIALFAAALASGSDAQSRRGSALPAANEVLHFLGTEPFWGGELRGGRMALNWPDDIKGVAIPISRRVAGSRLTIAGRLTVHPHFMPAGSFTMTVVRRNCSDGMSDRTYPYEVVLSYTGGRQLGCGWTRRRPYRDLPAG